MPNEPKRCKCGGRARARAISEWRQSALLTQTASGRNGLLLPEEPVPPLDENGEIDETVPCENNPEVMQVDVWAPAYLQWVRCEGIAQLYSNELIELDDLLSDYSECRGMTV